MVPSTREEDVVNTKDLFFNVSIGMGSYLKDGIPKVITSRHNH